MTQISNTAPINTAQPAFQHDDNASRTAPTRQHISTNPIRFKALHTMRTALMRSCCPFNIFPKPPQSHIDKRLSVLEKYADQLRTETGDNEPLEITEAIRQRKQQYSREDVKKLNDTYRSNASSLDIAGLSIIGFFAKNMGNCTHTPLGNIVARSQARLNPDKALYRGVGIPQAVAAGINSKNFPNYIEFGDKKISVRAILEKMLTNDDSNQNAHASQLQKLNDKFVNYALDSEHERHSDNDKHSIDETSIISTSLSHFVATGYCYKKLHGDIGYGSKKPTEAFPILFEIFGDKEKPARCMPAIGSAMLIAGAEDEVYLSPNTHFSFKEARKDEQNRTVITVTAKDLRDDTEHIN